MDKRTGKTLNQILALLTALTIMMAVAVLQSKRIAGHPLVSASTADTIATSTPDGVMTISTETSGKNIIGYGGPVPIKIQITDGKITDIKALPNAETPDFFKSVEESGIYNNWLGKTPRQALATNVDAVSGATFSSRALIENVRLALTEADKQAAQAQQTKEENNPLHSPVYWCSLAVVLLGAILPLLTKVGHRMRIIIQLLNVGVLGFWSGTFLSYALMVNYLANGLSLLLMLTPVIMLLAAFIYPLFGHPNHYCQWICPYGSLQDLATSICTRRIHLPPRIVAVLEWMRTILWCVLMALMLFDLWWEWLPNEIFSAFRPDKAALLVSITAIAFILLALFIPRPFCRFVCPTGTLFKMAESDK